MVPKLIPASGTFFLTVHGLQEENTVLHWAAFSGSVNVSEVLSLVVRKTFYCICENNNADQLRGNCEADQRRFRYTVSTIPLLHKSEISSL